MTRDEAVKLVDKLLDQNGLGNFKDQASAESSYVMLPTNRLEDCMDSLDVMELLMELENELNIIIPDSEVDQLKTFEEVVQYLMTKTNPDGN